MAKKLTCATIPTWMTLGATAIVLVIFISIAYYIASHWRKPEGFSNAASPSIVYLYMDSCKYCKEFSPVWTDLLPDFKKMNITAIKFSNKDPSEDAKKYLSHAEGFPTLLLVRGEGDVVVYKGDRTKSDILRFLQEETQSKGSKVKEGFDESTEFGQLLKSVSDAKKKMDEDSKSRGEISASGIQPNKKLIIK